MISASRIRAAHGLSQQLRLALRTFATSARQLEEATKAITPTPSTDSPVPKLQTEVPAKEVTQAPNRVGVWSRSQNPRSKAMTGPRFEQTDFDLQPQPYSAMELIHKQPVRWTHDSVVACDGGGGPTGHPRIFINTDKPEISVCNYCGLPFAHEHHRAHFESLPATSYPLEDAEGMGSNPPLSQPEPPH